MPRSRFETVCSSDHRSTSLEALSMAGACPELMWQHGSEESQRVG